eukprot:1241035-Amphidinium_carterae.1
MADIIDELRVVEARWRVAVIVRRGHHGNPFACSAPILMLQTTSNLSCMQWATFYVPAKDYAVCRETREFCWWLHNHVDLVHAN